MKVTDGSDQKWADPEVLVKNLIERELKMPKKLAEKAGSSSVTDNPEYFLQWIIGDLVAWKFRAHHAERILAFHAGRHTMATAINFAIDDIQGALLKNYYRCGSTSMLHNAGQEIIREEACRLLEELKVHVSFLKSEEMGVSR